MEEKKRLICIGGPTASGKTALAIKLAQKYSTEIISVDSRQLYKEMNIGTAKPSQFELDSIQHHFINHVSIQQHYDIGIFEKEAISLLTEKFKENNILIAVGGSGLYFKAIIDGIDEFPPVSPNIQLQVQEEYLKNGLDYLKQILEKVDPLYYKMVDINNPVRLIRAISVYRETGLPFSNYRKGKKQTGFLKPNVTF